MNPFTFSYSSINKLMFSPKLFYSHYILGEREEKLESYLVEGRLVHCYVLQPDEFSNLFVVAPNKVPTDNIKKLLHAMFERVGGGSLEDHSSTILELLLEQNLYQSFNEDSKRLEKVINAENQFYYDFIGNRDKTVVDSDMITRCKEGADILRDHPTIAKHISTTNSEEYVVFNELFLDCPNFRNGYGLKGIVDRMVINNKTNTCEIVDVKTTSKSITEFASDTIEYYNYWLQAAIYINLVNCQHNIPIEDISYSFWVIDKYNQTYNFGVSPETKKLWLKRFDEVFEKAVYHFSNFDFSLPYDLLASTRDKDSEGRILI